MARRPFTKERYDATLAAFRAAPGNFTHVATITGQAVPTVRDLWHKGWSDQRGDRIPWAPPIKEAIAEEQLAARRIAARQVQVDTGVPETVLEREQERQLVIQTRAQEAQLCKGARGNALALMGVISHCLRGSLKLAANVQKALDKMADKTDLDPRTCLAMFNKIAFMAKLAHDAGLKTMEMERLRTGEPQAIFGLVPAQEMTDEEAMETIAMAKSVAERAELLGLTVMDGGDDDAGEGEEPHKAAG